MLAKKIETLGPETLYELVVIKGKSLNKPVPLNLMVRFSLSTLLLPR